MSLLSHLSAIAVAGIITVAGLVSTSNIAAAMKIQEISTKSGIKLWLVEEHAVPLVAMRFAFEGGNSQDPAGKEGLAHFLSGMFDEGAGDLDAHTFQKRMEEIAMRMSFDDGKDAFYGSFETLTENRKASVALLKLALNKPRFDADAIDRVRNQLTASLAYAARDPNHVAGETWFQTAYAGHPYARPAHGTAETLKSITRDDLEGYRRRNFGKDTLRVVVVGDVNAADATAMVDDIFDALPAKANLLAVPTVAPNTTNKLKVVDMKVPQSVAVFGSPAMARKDKDFMAGFVLNHLLGGGGFASRLMEEVREKRGLAYSVYSYIQPLRHTSIFMGGVATKNEEMGQSLDVIRGELKRLAADGPTQSELDNAKSNLTGSFALRFDTNAKIANQLLYFLQEDFGVDYVDRRNSDVTAITLDDVKRVAKRLFAEDPFVAIVGQPKGLTDIKG